MNLVQKLSRPAVWTFAVMVALITSAVVAHATQSLSVPNAATVSYNLAAGANSAAITPSSSKPVFVMGVCTTAGTRGVGQVTLLRIPANFIEWVGLESPAGAAITSGFSGAAGTHIVYLDFGSQVDIEVNSPDTIRVHNGAAAARAGNVTLIW